MRTSTKSVGNILSPILILFFLFFSASCSKQNNANSGNVNQAENANANANIAAKDDAEELSNLIKLPFLPDEKEEEHVDWREETNPKGKKLTAIMKFNEANTAKLVAMAEKYQPATPAELEIEEWFPEELKAQTQVSGNETLKGSVYAANDFFNPPYNNGRLIRIKESDYFVLELTTY